MDTITKAALIFNAVKIPYEFFRKLCTSYSPDELFTHESILQELGLSQQQQARISSLIATDSWPERELERTEACGARFIHAGDLEYPSKLMDLRNPPIGLYVKGDANISSLSVAVVGTRKPCDYGRKIANNLGIELAKKGVVTISGGAKGIDAEGHRATLKEYGITIAVFGTSIDRVYPLEHRGLFERILERGALISEYPIGASGEAWHFTDRNRIIAAMSSGIVIVESPEPGGALNTAEHGFKLKRDVYAVPGPITNDKCKGSNKLISKGAKVLFDIEEFVNQFASRPEQLKLGIDAPASNEDHESHGEIELDDNEKLIYSLIRTNSGITADVLSEKSQLDILSVQNAILSLVAEGLVKEGSGRYSAID